MSPGPTILKEKKLDSMVLLFGVVFSKEPFYWLLQYLGNTILYMYIYVMILYIATNLCFVEVLEFQADEKNSCVGACKHCKHLATPVPNWKRKGRSKRTAVLPGNLLTIDHFSRSRPMLTSHLPSRIFERRNQIWQQHGAWCRPGLDCPSASPLLW